MSDVILKVKDSRYRSTFVSVPAILVLDALMEKKSTRDCWDYWFQGNRGFLKAHDRLEECIKSRFKNFNPLFGIQRIHVIR